VPDISSRGVCLPFSSVDAFSSAYLSFLDVFADSLSFRRPGNVREKTSLIPERPFHDSRTAVGSLPYGADIGCAVTKRAQIQGIRFARYLVRRELEVILDTFR
jgi:hypothetical protein